MPSHSPGVAITSSWLFSSIGVMRMSVSFCPPADAGAPVPVVLRFELAPPTLLAPPVSDFCMPSAELVPLAPPMPPPRPPILTGLRPGATLPELRLEEVPLLRPVKIAFR